MKYGLILCLWIELFDFSPFSTALRTKLPSVFNTQDQEFLRPEKRQTSLKSIFGDELPRFRESLDPPDGLVKLDPSNQAVSGLIEDFHDFHLETEKKSQELDAKETYYAREEAQLLRQSEEMKEREKLEAQNVRTEQQFLDQLAKNLISREDQLQADLEKIESTIGSLEGRLVKKEDKIAKEEEILKSSESKFSLMDLDFDDMVERYLEENDQNQKVEEDKLDKLLEEVVNERQDIFKKRVSRATNEGKLEERRQFLEEQRYKLTEKRDKLNKEKGKLDEQKAELIAEKKLQKDHEKQVIESLRQFSDRVADQIRKVDEEKKSFTYQLRVLKSKNQQDFENAQRKVQDAEDGMEWLKRTMADDSQSSPLQEINPTEIMS